MLVLFSSIISVCWYSLDDTIIIGLLLTTYILSWMGMDVVIYDCMTNSTSDSFLCNIDRQTVSIIHSWAFYYVFSNYASLCRIHSHAWQLHIIGSCQLFRYKNCNGVRWWCFFCYAADETFWCNFREACLFDRRTHKDVWVYGSDGSAASSPRSVHQLTSRVGLTAFVPHFSQRAQLTNFKIMVMALMRVQGQ